MPLAGSAWIAIHSPAPTISSSRATSPEGGQTIAKPPAVGADLGGGAEQGSQAGGVAEVDVGEVDEQSRAPAGARRVEPRAQPRRRRDVQLTGDVDDLDAGFVVLVDRERIRNGVAHRSTFSGSGRGVNCCSPSGSSRLARLSFFLGFGFGSTTRKVRAFTPTGPLGPWASIRTR